MEFTIPGTKEYMINSEFWIKKLSSPDRLIMTPENIQIYNNKIIDTIEDMCIVKNCPDIMFKEELYNLITSYEFSKDERYDDTGELISDKCYKSIFKNLNLSNINEENRVFFGLALKSTSVRSFPTSMGCYKESTNTEFDRFQETECPALDPVAILHVSSDGAWYFIQMNNYVGWVNCLDIAIAYEKSKVFDYTETEDFLMVIGDKATTQFNHCDNRLSRNTYYMGTKIPLIKTLSGEICNQSIVHNYVVKLPLRNTYGFLNFGEALISKSEPVHEGYLPFTQRNLLTEAFSLLGDRYDWGNKHNGRDCSSYIMYLYRTLGILLPRNADQQEDCPGIKCAFTVNSSLQERSEALKGVSAGAMLFMNGHIMLYLGMEDSEPFMIHDFHRYSIKTADSITIHSANEVAVTSTLLTTESGRIFLDTFTTVLEPSLI